MTHLYYISSPAFFSSASFVVSIVLQFLLLSFSLFPLLHFHLNMQIDLRTLHTSTHHTLTGI